MNFCWGGVIYWVVWLFCCLLGRLFICLFDHRWKLGEFESSYRGLDSVFFASHIVREREREREREINLILLITALNISSTNPNHNQSIKEMNSIPMINHHQSVEIIHTHACGTIELTWCWSLFTIITKSLQQLITLAWIINTNNMWITRHIHKSIEINTSTTRITIHLDVGDVLMAITTPNGQTIVVMISHQEKRWSRWQRGKMMMKMTNTIWILKLSFILASTSKSVEESTTGIKSLQSMIGVISHKKGAIWRTTYTIWIMKFTLGMTWMTSSSNGKDERIEFIGKHGKRDDVHRYLFDLFSFFVCFFNFLCFIQRSVTATWVFLYWRKEKLKIANSIEKEEITSK